MTHSDVIAIDGPAASGKSTVGRLLAQRLGYHLLDTGTMYRAATLDCLRAGIDLTDPQAVIRRCLVLDIEVVDDKNGGRVLVGGKDVMSQIREPEVTAKVGYVADIGAVRQMMVRKQRRFAGGGPTVAVGRDMGTVVFPAARHKFYLDASEAVRVERRRAELAASGAAVDTEEVLSSIRRRDREDAGRVVSPLRVADGAEVIDTSELTTEAVVELLLKRVRGRAG